MATTLDPERPSSAPPQAGGPALAPFDARRTAEAVAQDMATVLQAWRSGPEPQRPAAPRETWRGTARGGRGGTSRASSGRTIFTYAAGAGLAGIVVGLLLAQPHHAPLQRLSPQQVQASPPREPAGGQVAEASLQGAGAPAPAPSQDLPAPPPRPDPIGRLYARLEAHRLAWRRRHPSLRGGPACPRRAGAEREACLGSAIDQADQELRRSYQLAIDRRLAPAALNRYREAWSRLRRRDAGHPQALIGGYRRLALEIRRAAGARSPARPRVFGRRAQEEPWYY